MSRNSNYFLIFLSISIFQVFAQTFSKDVGEFKSNQFPANVTIAEGDSFHIRLTKVVDQQTTCSYVAPTKRESAVSTDRIKIQFGGGCSVIVLNVTEADTGVWYLNSKSSDKQIRGSTIVKVMKRFDDSLIGDDIGKLLGQIPKDKNFNYCYVTKFDGINNNVRISNYKCVLPESNQTYGEGSYMVHLGMPGQIKELKKEMRVVNYDEVLEPSVEITETRLRLACKIKNYRNSIEFCRFMRVEDEMGLNLIEGVSDIKYTYYGKVDNGECGLEISTPDALDRGTWKCFVGVVDKCEKNKFYNHSALLDASNASEKLRILNMDEVDFYVQNNQSAILRCDANQIFDYCWFMHPTGKVLSVPENRDERDKDSDIYEYYGNGFHLGECSIKFKTLNPADAGEWKCGVGNAKRSSTEATKTFNIRVITSGMRTVAKQINEFSNGPLMIECHTVPKGIPLEYCRFLTPSGFGFSINENITYDNALEGNYYFDPNRKLSEGFCTVVIKRASVNDHAGNWICSGRTIVGDFEQFDTIEVRIDGIQTAGFSWLGFGLAVGIISILVISFMVYRSFKRGVIGRVINRDLIIRRLSEISRISNPAILNQRNETNASFEPANERLASSRDRNSVNEVVEVELHPVNSRNSENDAVEVELRPVNSSVA